MRTMSDWQTTTARFNSRQRVVFAFAAILLAPSSAAAQQRFAALGVVNLGAVVSGTREQCYGFGYQPAA